MSIVLHKYTPEQMPETELEAIFAAREETLDYLLARLREQIPARTLSSFIITGPRGSGKTTLLRLLRMRIRKDSELNAAWLPVAFTEEQFHITSLRDLLAGALEILERQGVAEAALWRKKVEDERDNEQSQELAAMALRDIARRQKKRLILFVENLNRLLDDRFDDLMKGTLRRLLMTEDFMILIGSAVRVFESLLQYDEAFFNYFHPVTLGRLDDEQIFSILRKRGEFDGNESFLKDLDANQANIRALAHLSGGNPRLVLMLYELLSENKTASAVQYLRRLVDELTPLYKHELENLPPQQAKIIHALMEKGGTDTPSDLANLTRLPLNIVTMQLKRLKDAQILDLRGGGKGRTAYYTVTDTMFSFWYRMRVLSRQHCVIERFVEIISIWLGAEERRLIPSYPIAQDASSSSGGARIREDAGSLKYTAMNQHRIFEAEPAMEDSAAIMNWLTSLSVANTKDAWLNAYEALAASQPPAVFESIGFLSSVARALKTNDASQLDPLPPEQREFAEQILSKFLQSASAAFPEQPDKG
ncbi:MAG: AAA family ATPase [Candidatus Sumerlaeota bacterium]|nr:AAA family ATPase [Candidatus Sumerlaeota bacterium]